MSALSNTLTGSVTESGAGASAFFARPAVETAQVIGVPDARLGEVPAAYVTLKANVAVTESELLDWCKVRCANFRVPCYLRIVKDFEAIGMAASGKVQKVKLREHAIRELNL